VVLFAAYVLLCALRRISLHDSELAQARRCGSPSPGWRTFLHNHAPDIAAMDLFVAPTIGFDLLYFDWSAKPCLDQRHITSDRGMDRTALPSPTDYGPWVSATSPLPQARLGRTDSPKD
jgi:hypothetical protein